jgi:hypothetical protein
MMPAGAQRWVKHASRTKPVKKSMVDPAFIDKLAYWVNFVFIVAVCITLASTVLVVVLSQWRTAGLRAEMQRLQTETAQQIKEAREEAIVLNDRVAAADSAAGHVRNQAEQAREKLNQEKVELRTQLEKEKRLRLEAESRLLRPLAAASGQKQPFRRLTSAQEHELLLRLRRFEGRRVTVVELADDEAGALARQLTAVLSDARWDVLVSRIGALNPAQYAIICVHAPGDEAAALLVELLRSFDLTVYERGGGRQLQVLVGLKPL